MEYIRAIEDYNSTNEQEMQVYIRLIYTWAQTNSKGRHDILTEINATYNM